MDTYSQQIITVEYKGLKKTKHTFVDKIIGVKPQSLLDSVLIAKDIQNLRRVPSFANVTHQISKDSITHSYKLTYLFEENKTIIPYPEIWTSIRQTTFRIGITEFNFLGRNMSIGGFYQNNGFHSFSFYYKAPFLFSKKIGLDFNAYQLRSEEPLYFKEKTANYQYTNAGVDVGLLYMPHFNHRFRVGINPFSEKYVFLSGANSDDVPLLAEKRKILLKLYYEYNHLFYHYYLLKGFKITSYYQQILVPDDFQIFWTDVHNYKRIKKRGNFASRLRLGIATNSISPFAPFALDNNLNIRGIGNIIDRATGTIVSNTEYRHTFYEKKWFVFQGNMFIDAGTWRTPGGGYSDFIRFQNMELYAGGGIRLIHKFFYGAALRVDYGFDLKNLKNSGLVFGFGQYF